MQDFTLSLDFGTSWLLRQRIGVHRAKELAFTAKMLSAAEAYELGLVNAVVPAADVPDPQALGIRCVLNGETMQDSTTANMIFGVAEIIAYASATMTFEPGDLIATGTPAGVGVFRDPPVLLKEGDEVTIEIDGLGSLTNPVRVEPA